jgi:hypothetical protein
MKISLTVAVLSAVFGVSSAFSTVPVSARSHHHVAMSTTTFLAAEATMAEAGVPPTTSETTSTEDTAIPTNLPSDCGMDYVPLATMLATGQLAEADQVSTTKSGLLRGISEYGALWIS